MAADSSWARRARARPRTAKIPPRSRTQTNVPGVQRHPGPTTSPLPGTRNAEPGTAATLQLSSPRQRHLILGGPPMRTLRSAASVAALVLILGAGLSGPIGAATQTAKPEDVGLSSDRLKRITDLIDRQIKANT